MASDTFSHDLAQSVDCFDDKTYFYPTAEVRILLEYKDLVFLGVDFSRSTNSLIFFLEFIF